MGYSANEARYTDMRYVYCGQSGLKLPLLSLGFWHNFGANADYQNARALCFAAFDRGITHFDLANNYGPPYGAAEVTLGRILKEDLCAYRDELLLSTKAGYDMWPGPYGDRGSRKYMIASIDQSLKRLGVEYVDIFYHHRPDPQTPLEETMTALSDIVRQGKALYIGISNYDGPTMQKAAALLDALRCPFIINQCRYSIFDRTIEQNGLKDAAQAAGKGIIAFSPLAQGLLTNRYIDGVPADSRIGRDGRYLSEKNLTPETLQRIRLLHDIATARGESLAQMALRWVLRDDVVTSVLIGASKPSQIEENLGILAPKPFTPSELSAIERCVCE